MKLQEPNGHVCRNPTPGVESWPLIDGLEVQITRNACGVRFGLSDGRTHHALTGGELIDDRVRVAHRLQRAEIHARCAALSAGLAAQLRRAGAQAVQLLAVGLGRPQRPT